MNIRYSEQVKQRDHGKPDAGWALVEMTMTIEGATGEVAHAIWMPLYSATDYSDYRNAEAEPCPDQMVLMDDGVYEWTPERVWRRVTDDVTVLRYGGE